LIPFKVNLGETKEISYFTAYVYNTLWSGIRNSRSGPIALQGSLVDHTHPAVLELATWTGSRGVHSPSEDQKLKEIRQKSR
jgi:hypothetical protein